MNSNTSQENIQITVLEAMALPKVWVHTPDCRAAITVGSDRKVTQRVKDDNPVWNKPFLFAAKPGSKVSIEILHGKYSMVIAEAVTSVKSEHLQTGTVASDEIVPLKLRVSSILRRNPTIVLSFSAASSNDTHAFHAPQSPTSGLAPQGLEILSEASAVEPPPPSNQDAPCAPQSPTSGLAPQGLEVILSEASAVEPSPPSNQDSRAPRAPHSPTSGLAPQGLEVILSEASAVESRPPSNHDTRAPRALQSPTTDLALQDLEVKARAVEPRPPSNQKFSDIVQKLNQFVILGNAIAEVHPYAKVVWGLLTSGLSVLNEHYERNARIRDLWACVLETLDFMKDAESLHVKSLTGTVQAMMEQLCQCIIYLEKHRERSTAENVVKAIFAEDDSIIQRFTDAFKQLKVQFDQRINVQQWKITQATGEQVAMISNKIDMLVRESEGRQLERLLAPDLHTHWSSTCLSGTREKLLSDILSWAQSDTSPSMLWLSGAAGTGKSSVAGSVAELLKSKNILGAFVGFRRDIAVDDTPSHLFGSIACQIAIFHEHVRQNVLSAIQDKLPNIHMLHQQARELVVQPLLSSVALPRVVIVIDALDECAADSGKNGKPGREKLVDVLVTEFAALPSFVKVFITSRKEGIITQQLQKFKSLQNIDLTSVDETQEDISKYITCRIKKIQQRDDDLNDWPDVQDVSQLAIYADKLFVWADVACSYIETGDPPINLGRLLSKEHDAAGPVF
ncbi:hypothetical protein D9615_010558 [Tricholomella constricta]|uniref:C2 domain-containing protein n=1 Tax=Tricholomella constricta TaxID=117010 RepID=A0A8H5M0T2_9AGAR|nr:hypothetical protein D9615_010558 [Tricholomella constricta]